MESGITLCLVAMLAQATPASMPADSWMTAPNSKMRSVAPTNGQFAGTWNVVCMPVNEDCPNFAIGFSANGDVTELDIDGNDGAQRGMGEVYGAATIRGGSPVGAVETRLPDPGRDDTLEPVQPEPVRRDPI